MFNKASLIFFISLMIISCQSIPVADNASEIKVNFSWSSKSSCSTISPKIELDNVPDGTKFLKVKMVDLNVPRYEHGGGEVIYSGTNTIEEGGLTSYNGPCPPSTHVYEFTVTAINESRDLILGVGKKSREYPE